MDTALDEDKTMKVCALGYFWFSCWNTRICVCLVPCAGLSVYICIMYRHSTGWRQDLEGLCPQALFVLTMSQHWMKTRSWRFMPAGTFCSDDVITLDEGKIMEVYAFWHFLFAWCHNTGERQDHEGLCPQALFVLIFHGAKILGYTSGAMCIYVCIMYRNSTGWRKIITVSVLRCFLFLFSIMLKCCGLCLFCATCRYNCISLRFVTDMYSHLCLPLV